MNLKPGRKPFVTEEVVKSVILQRESEIFLDNNKLKSKSDPVWQALSNDIDGKLSAATFYSKLCNPEFRRKIFGQSVRCHNSLHSDSQFLESTVGSDNKNDSMHEKSLLEFAVFADKAEYEKLLVSKEMNYKNGTKYCYRLEPGRWENWISEGIYYVSKVSCGFNFQKHVISADGTYGTVKGMIIIFLYLINKISVY